MSDAPDDVYAGLELCPICGRESCDEHLPAPPHPSRKPAPRPGKRRGLDPALLQDATQVIAEGQQLAKDGIRYVVDGMIPAYGMVGMLIARTKVGKSTFSQSLAAAVAMGESFLDRSTTQTRVLVIAAEDPPEYTAWLTRHLNFRLLRQIRFS